MAKLNLIQRLFWSSEKIEKYFLENSQSNEGVLSELIQEQKARLQEQVERINEKDQIINDLRNKLIREETNNRNASEQTEQLKQKIQFYETKRAELETALHASRNEKVELSKQINSKLETLSKIETTFFGKSGNKGKGMLGEMQLAKILQASGFPEEFYIQGLQVNSNIVEFAIQSGVDNKWIPVDSKTLEVDLDDNGIIVITEDYVRKVRTAAKEITKYLSKSNTADYGLLVLQSDEIYMKLYEYNPVLFQQMIKDNKIYITSPSSFVNFASSISHILDIYAKVHNEEKLYEEIIGLMDTTRKFADNMHKSYKSFKVAMETHYPALENKHTKIRKTLDSHDNIKEVKKIEEK